MKHFAQRTRIVIREFVHAAEMAPAADKDLEGPDGPVGNYRNEAVVLAYDPDLLLLFQGDVVTKEARLMRVPVCSLNEQLLGGSLWNR